MSCVDVVTGRVAGVASQDGEIGAGYAKCRTSVVSIAE